MSGIKSPGVVIIPGFFFLCCDTLYLLPLTTKRIMKDFLFNASRILSRTRYPWVDYARGITIILVVYRHVFEGLGEEVAEAYPALEYFNTFFFSFRMPLFFMISGLFFQQTIARNGLPLFIKKRFSTIFYPLLIWGAIQVTLQLLLKNAGVNANREPIDYLNLLINPREIEQFWYLNALFFVGVLYALLQHYLKFTVRTQLVFGTLLFGICALVTTTQLSSPDRMYPWNIMNFSFIFDVAFFYIFFAIGNAISKYVLHPNNYKYLTSFKALLLVLPVFLIVQYFFTEINLGKFPSITAEKNDYFVQYHMPWLYLIAAIAGGSFIVLISFLLEKAAILKFLRVIGYHSLYIYAAHLLVTSGTRIVFTKILGVSYAPAIMIAGLILGIAVPMILYNLAVRLNAWWLFASMPTPDVKQKDAR